MEAEEPIVLAGPERTKIRKIGGGVKGITLKSAIAKALKGGVALDVRVELENGRRVLIAEVVKDESKEVHG